MTTENGNIVETVLPAGSSERFVRLQNVPFKVALSEVNEALGKFGKVLKSG